MNETKMYSAVEVCDELGITSWTLQNWYRWETKQKNSGIISETSLPQPLRIDNLKGKPRRWTEEMVDELKTFKSNMVMGRHGIYGKYSNPAHFETKKYKKSLETVDN